jgi:hypothetical protein
MRRMCAIGLTLTLCGLPLPATSADGPELSGPIGRAVALEASRLAAGTPGQPAQIQLGSLIGFTVAYGSDCYRGCAGARAATLGLIIGVPIAVGYGAWHASSRLVEELVYVRQAGQP